MVPHNSGILLYNATAYYQNYEYNRNSSTYGGIILVTDIGVSVKVSPYQMLVLVRSLKDNKPVAGASVYNIFLGENKEAVYLGKTDNRGILQIENNGRFDASPCIAVKSGNSLTVNYGYGRLDHEYYYDYNDTNIITFLQRYRRPGGALGGGTATTVPGSSCSPNATFTIPASPSRSRASSATAATTPGL
jgi:hypothetical protein